MKDTSWFSDVTIDDLPEAHRKFADVLGVNNTLMLCDYFGGGVVSIPRIDKVYNKVVGDKKIAEAYQKGMTFQQLRKTFCLSKVQITRIVKASIELQKATRKNVKHANS